MHGSIEARQHYRVTLPGVVYDRCLQFPVDLRVIDGTGGLWPHVLLQTDKGKTRILATEERNRSAATEGRLFQRIDLHITEKGDARHDGVIIKTSGTRFVRMAEVYGAETEGDWVLVGKGYLIRDQRRHRVLQETIVYPRADFPRVQIRVYPNAGDATETFTIGSVSLRGHVRAAPPMEMLTVVPLDPAADDLNDKAEVRVVDLGYRNRPFDQVWISCDRADYVRTVSVYGRNDLDEPWRHLGSGDIQALDGSVRDRVDVSGASRYVKCEIFHYDDQPLDVTSVEVLAIPDVVLVEAGEGSDPCMYAGNEFARSPRYDLAKRLTSIDTDKLPTLTLGDAETNPAYRRGGFGELGPWLAGIAVGIVSLLVLYVIVGMLKKSE